MSYQPKLNLEMARIGYIGADPRTVGLTGGYQTRITQPTQKPKQEPAATTGTRRPNPYMK